MQWAEGEELSSHYLPQCLAILTSPWQAIEVQHDSLESFLR